MTDFTYTSYKTSGPQPHDSIQRGFDLEALPFKDGLLVCSIDGIFYLDLNTFEWEAVFEAPKPDCNWWQSCKAVL